MRAPDFRRATTATPDTAPSRFRLVLIIGALSAFGPLSLDMYLPGLPSVSHDLNSSPSQTQLTLTACLLGLPVAR